jgi:L,D-transpeptidase YcbB
VNIASYWIYYMRGQEVVWNARAQVGKTYRQTPMFRSAINYLVFNPTWTVPPGIIRNDILPAARKDPASITRRNLNVLDASGNRIDPASVDWSKFKSGNIPYTLRQEPGPKNALGRVKFMFPNSYSVYLHDTPSSSLFESPDRAFSSGCVRVERPLELAALLLANPAMWNPDTIARTIDAGRTQNVTLASKVPVLLAYWTAWVDPQGRVNFRRDVYGQDAKWLAGLAGAYQPKATN